MELVSVAHSGFVPGLQSPPTAGAVGLQSVAASRLSQLRGSERVALQNPVKKITMPTISYRA
jgi:hypothetical protein